MMIYLFFFMRLWYNKSMKNLKEPPKIQRLTTQPLPYDELVKTCNELQVQLIQTQTQLAWAMEQITLLTHKKFGSGSDKVAYPEGCDQLSFFNEPESAADFSVPEPDLEDVLNEAGKPRKKKTRGKREKDFSNLATIVIEHELPESERICPNCSHPLHDMKVEITRLLKFIPARFEVEEHRRHVYTCRECAKHDDGMDVKIPFIRAAMPNTLIPGSFTTPELVAAIINAKYVCAMPLARQQQEFERYSVAISRQTMSNWLLRCAEDYFSLLYRRMREIMLTRDILHGDETSVQVANETNRPATSQSYMWVYCTGVHDETPMTYYDYHPTRSKEAALSFLGTYKGYLHADGYEVYHHLTPDITVVGCLAHVKRGFADAIKALSKDEQKRTASYEGVQFCDAIFHIDKKLNDCSPAERKQKRLNLLKPVMAAFHDWLIGMQANALPKSYLSNAVNYTLNQWTYLENVLLDGRLELTNNRAERSIRPFTIGRKNWVMHNTPEGATASAMIYSLTESAKSNQLKPYNYLVYILKEMSNTDLVNHPELIDQFLPWSKTLSPDCYNTN
jgi:transposase